MPWWLYFSIPTTCKQHHFNRKRSSKNAHAYIIRKEKCLFLYDCLILTSVFFIFIGAKHLAMIFFLSLYILLYLLHDICIQICMRNYVTFCEVRSDNSNPDLNLTGYRQLFLDMLIRWVRYFKFKLFQHFLKILFSWKINKALKLGRKLQLLYILAYQESPTVNFSLEHL